MLVEVESLEIRHPNWSESPAAAAEAATPEGKAAESVSGSEIYERARGDSLRGGGETIQIYEL